MKFSPLFFICILLFSFSCSEPEADNFEAIQTELEALKTEQLANDSILDNSFEVLAKIDSSFQEIRKKRIAIRSKMKENIETKGVQADIVNHVNSIDTLLLKNRELIESVTQQIGDSSSASQMLIMVLRMMDDNVKDTQESLNSLKSELASLSDGFVDLFNEYVNAEKERWDLSDELNTAWVAIDTKKALKEKGLLDNKGNIFSVKKLKQDFDTSQFTQINITVDKEFKINARKAKLITNHPSDSYELVEEKGSVSSIKITDPIAFWKVSKYMLIEVNR